MSEIMVRERFLRSGKKVYEYSFEMASVDGKRKRKSKSGFASKRDARIAGRKALSEYENVGQVMVDRDISYADFLDLWMENDCKLTCKESTLYGYEKKIRLYLKPELGGYRVSSIDKKILQTFITDLYNDGFSINTIISIKGLLTKSFNYALENHYIMISPANKLVIPQNMQPDKPTRRKEHIYLTKDNIDSLFERFPKGTSSFVPLQIAYHTGMRPGEVFGLVWDDIDFDNKVINVNRQIQWRQVKRSKKDIKKTNGTSESLGYWYFTSPKYKSYRVIDIDDVLVSILKEEYEKQNLNVTVDGQACASMEQRDKILKSYNENNVALSFDEVANANQARIRELIQGKNIVYIYHNQVDARGDKPASENEVFNACAEAIEEIHKLVKKLTGYVSAPKFFITADHGFLYKRDRLQEFDKNILQQYEFMIDIAFVDDFGF